MFLWISYRAVDLFLNVLYISTFDWFLNDLLPVCAKSIKLTIQISLIKCFRAKTLHNFHALQPIISKNIVLFSIEIGPQSSWYTIVFSKQTNPSPYSKDLLLHYNPEKHAWCVKSRNPFSLKYVPNDKVKIFLALYIHFPYSNL